MTILSCFHLCAFYKLIELLNIACFSLPSFGIFSPCDKEAIVEIKICSSEDSVLCCALLIYRFFLGLL